MVRRILVKLSGESFLGDQEFGFEKSALSRIAKLIKSVSDKGIEVGLVIGGGNLVRGKTLGLPIDQSSKDQIGILATAMNGIALLEMLRNEEVDARLMSAFPCADIPLFSKEKAIRHLEKGRVMIFVCGTGNPYFTTDSAAALRAAQIKADLLIKATNVDGIYDRDPKAGGATKYTELTHLDMIEKRLGIMDLTAADICHSAKIPILVLNFSEEDALLKACFEKNVGTFVKTE